MTKLRTPKARYSNLGFELLGHALARASGLTYAEMVRRRFADPLGLTTFYVPAAPEELRPTALVGTSRFGRPRRPWTGEAIGPAGGIRAGIEDMAVLAQSLLNGSAPGLAAPGARLPGACWWHPRRIPPAPCWGRWRCRRASANSSRSTIARSLAEGRRPPETSRRRLPLELARDDEGAAGRPAAPFIWGARN